MMLDEFPADRYDAVILGGGPAGGAAAIELARAGRRVLVLERSTFPRHHVGESMVLSVRGLLADLGVAEKMEEVGFIHKYGSTHVWGNSTDMWSIYFRDIAPGQQYSYQVDRAIFDQVLLAHAEECGADVWLCTAATDVALNQDDVVISYQGGDGRGGKVRATCLIDATGQQRFLARRTAQLETTFDPLLRNIAVYRYFRGSGRLLGENYTNFLLEAFPDGWFWHIPLHTGVASVGAVVGQESLPEVRATGLDRYLDRQIGRTKVLRDLLLEADDASPTRLINDGSYVVGRFAGDRFLIAGDAAGFIDPMFAPGVSIALQSGRRAAAAVDYALRFPAQWEAVSALYDEDLRRAYSSARYAVVVSYSSNSLFDDEVFWHNRKLSEEQMQAMTDDAPFMRAMQRGGALSYERYSLDFADLPPVISSGLMQVDGERSARQAFIDGSGAKVGNWILAWHPSVKVCRDLGFQTTGGRMAMGEGLRLEHDGEAFFLSDPLHIAVCEAIDGRCSISEAMDHALRSSSPASQLVARMGLTALLLRGYTEGLFNVRGES